MNVTIEERDIEIEKNMGFIGLEAKKKLSLAQSNGYEYSDLINAGVQGVIHAIKKFDPNHESGANILTYAKYWIRQKITHAAREKDKLRKVSISLETPILDAVHGSVPLSEIIANKSVDAQAGKGLDYEFLHGILNGDTLNEMEKITIQMRYFEGAKLKEIDAVLQDIRPKAKAFFYLETAQRKLKKALQEHLG